LSRTVQAANHRKAIGLLYAGVQTAANAAVPRDQAGLAAALITTSFQLGSALGPAVLSGIATSRTSHLLAARTPPPKALTAGFQRALLVSALCLPAAGAIALRASNTRGEPPHQKPSKTWNPPTTPHNTKQRNRRVCVDLMRKRVDRRVWIVSAHQRRRRRVTEVSGLNPVHRCSGLASRWRACGYGLEAQEISDADKPQHLPFHRADAAAGLVVIQAR